jgi:hypothetical protein
MRLTVLGSAELSMLAIPRRCSLSFFKAFSPFSHMSQLTQEGIMKKWETLLNMKIEKENCQDHLAVIQ